MQADFTRPVQNSLSERTYLCPCRQWRSKNMASISIIRFVFCDIRFISFSLRLQLIILTSTLIILDITKTSSNIFLASGSDYLQIFASCLRTGIHHWKTHSDRADWENRDSVHKRSKRQKYFNQIPIDIALIEGNIVRIQSECHARLKGKWNFSQLLNECFHSYLNSLRVRKSVSTYKWGRENNCLLRLSSECLCLGD